ncbi:MULTISPECIES: hypothetical protein [Streptomyces]
MERTQTIDTTTSPRTTLTTPSYAAQILIITAHLLGESVDPVTTWIVGELFNTATDAVCGTLPPAVRDNAATIARTALPPTRRNSCGQYAASLRDLAQSL